MDKLTREKKKYLSSWEMGPEEAGSVLGEYDYSPYISVMIRRS